MVWSWRRDRGPDGRSTGRDVVDGPDGPDGPWSDPSFVAGLRPIPTGEGSGDGGDGQPSPGSGASDIVGVSPAGDGVEFRIGEVAGSVLVAFLAIRCDGCDEFWRGLAGGAGPPLPPSVTPVIVTRGPDAVPPAEVARLAEGAGTVPVVMSDGAWVDYRVLGYPFLVLVDAATRTVVSETVGFGWSDLVRMVETSGR